MFARNRVADILASDPGTKLTLDDTRIRETRSQASDGRWGVGFILIGEATLVGNRLAIERGQRGLRPVGADRGAGSQLTLKRARLLETIGVLNFGDGVVASKGATAVLEVQVGSSCVFENNTVRVAAAFAAVQRLLAPAPPPPEY